MEQFIYAGLLGVVVLLAAVVTFIAVHSVFKSEE